MNRYSETPLVKKIGYKPGFRVFLRNAPENFLSLLGPLPDGVRFLTRPGSDLDMVHLFTREAAELRTWLPRCRAALKPDGMIWVSWPKKASGVASDITEDTVRSLALAMDLVDIKVCAIDDIWSGLKLVIPVAHRQR